MLKKALEIERVYSLGIFPCSRHVIGAPKFSRERQKLLWPWKIFQLAGSGIFPPCQIMTCYNTFLELSAHKVVNILT